MISCIDYVDMHFERISNPTFERYDKKKSICWQNDLDLDS